MLVSCFMAFELKFYNVLMLTRFDDMALYLLDLYCLKPDRFCYLDEVAGLSIVMN